MVLGIVEKPVVSTVKHACLEGKRLYWVRPVKPDLSSDGESFVTIDTVKARVGSLVLVNKEGSGSLEVLGLKDSPVQSVIVGIVDKVKGA